MEMLWKIQKNREFCTFNDKFFRDFIRKSIRGFRASALNGCFESNQSEEILNTIKKLLKTNDNEISNKVDEYKKYFNIQRHDFKLEFENGEKDYRKVNEMNIDNFLDKKLRELKYRKELQKINKDDLLVSYDFNCLYP